MPTTTKKKPAVNAKKSNATTQPNIDAQISKQKKTVAKLKSQISDLKILKSNRDIVESEVDALSERKKQLNAYVAQNNSKEKAFKKIIEGLTTQKNELDTYIDEKTPKKETLKSELSDLEVEKDKVNAEIEVLKNESASVSTMIEELNRDKKQVNDQITELKTQYGLYPRHLKDISKDYLKQLKTYGWLTGLSITVILIFIGLMIWMLTSSNPAIDRYMEIFPDEPILQFYSMLTGRLSITAAFLILVVIFMKLARGFASQYIKVRDKLSNLKVVDFLVGKIENDKTIKGAELTKYYEDLIRKTHAKNT